MYKCIHMTILVCWQNLSTLAVDAALHMVGNHYTFDKYIFWYIIFINYAVCVLFFMTSQLGVADGLLSILGGLFTNF